MLCAWIIVAHFTYAGDPVSVLPGGRLTCWDTKAACMRLVPKERQRLIDKNLPVALNSVTCERLEVDP